MFYQAVVTLYQLTQHNITECETSTSALRTSDLLQFITMCVKCTQASGPLALPESPWEWIHTSSGHQKYKLELLITHSWLYNKVAHLEKVINISQSPP
jgi:hypothetical protein